MMRRLQKEQMVKTHKIVMSLAAGVLLLVPASLSLRAQQPTPGAVYTMTNDPGGNSVLVFDRGNDGTLTAAGSFATGGLGTGGREPDFGLANAHAIAMSEDHRLLFAVNPGSNDVSVFRVRKDGLSLVDRKPSGGVLPISIAVHRQLAYVLNAGGNVGGSDNISGFTVGPDGTLEPLAGSTRPLSADATNPAQIAFTPDGRVLIVTERIANNIDTYTVGLDGLPAGPIVTPDDAQNPFGFYVANGDQLFVADDFNDDAGAAALSSFRVSDDGSLALVSSAVPSNESGACWVIVGRDGRFAYVVNTVSSTISIYNIDKRSGSVTFSHSSASLFNPTDLDFSRDGRFLYVLNPDQNGQSSPGINVFRVEPQDGSLTFVGSVTGLPSGVDGLIAE